MNNTSRKRMRGSAVNSPPSHHLARTRPHPALSARPPGLVGRPETTAHDRQEIVRVLLEQVTVDVQGDSEQVDVTLRWAGGAESAPCQPPGRLL